ncbi:MAG TPA: metallophosphoesterase [Actinomycetota bacterium]|nr:metallophosphoesterase [Actinomycetota bacterium]
MVAAGDVAGGVGGGDSKYTGDLIQANINRYFKVLALGDLQYPDGRYSDFLASYDKTWGKFKAKTAPVMGNHEADGAGYFDYFNGVGAANGPAGARGKGWYSYDTGNAKTSGWHVVALNSECVGKPCGTEQLTWLQTDLASTVKPCTMAYWHKPRFSSGNHGDDAKMQPFWNLLNQHGAEVVLSGHDHDYERFAPMNASGVRDDARGVRQFVVGTGGIGFRGIGNTANSQTRNTDTLGALEVGLQANSYSWKFVRATSPGNGTFTDSGTTTCHGK